MVSAQHLRHTLATMQQIAPDIRPYGRVDVMASMDPFGWGTGAGVVEEEEEEEEEEDEEEDDEDKDSKGNDGDDGNAGSIVQGSSTSDSHDHDDMDISD